MNDTAELPHEFKQYTRPTHSHLKEQLRGPELGAEAAHHLPRQTPLHSHAVPQPRMTQHAIERLDALFNGTVNWGFGGRSNDSTGCL